MFFFANSYMSKNEAIALYQPLLYSIALRMVGTLEDAEDIVQDTFEKWLKIDNSKIQNVKAYLVKSVSNNCLNFLSSFWSRISASEDTELVKEELEDSHQHKSIFQFDLEAQVHEAWEVIHRKLEPIEKQLFILREVFNVEYEEMQHLFDKKKENCRQIVSRARAKIKSENPKLNFQKPSNKVPQTFTSACSTGGYIPLLNELKSDL